MEGEEHRTQVADKVLVLPLQDARLKPANPFTGKDPSPLYMADAAAAFSHGCMYFRTVILKTKAMLVCAASETFIATGLVRQLGLKPHHLRTPLHIQLADGTILYSTEFVRVHLKIGSWRLRMTFWILPSPLPLLLGIPFLCRF